MADRASERKRARGRGREGEEMFSHRCTHTHVAIPNIHPLVKPIEHPPKVYLLPTRSHMSGPDVSGMAMTVLSVRNGPNIGCTAARMVLTVRNASDKAVLLPGMEWGLDVIAMFGPVNYGKRKVAWYHAGRVSSLVTLCIRLLTPDSSSAFPSDSSREKTTTGLHGCQVPYVSSLFEVFDAPETEVKSAICLRTCYAVPGTDVAHGATYLRPSTRASCHLSTRLIRDVRTLGRGRPTAVTPSSIPNNRRAVPACYVMSCTCYAVPGMLYARAMRRPLLA
eukprot:1264724-Rhodomonas_salina.1